MTMDEIKDLPGLIQWFILCGGIMNILFFVLVGFCSAKLTGRKKK